MSVSVETYYYILLNTIKNKLLDNYNVHIRPLMTVKRADIVITAI